MNRSNAIQTGAERDKSVLVGFNTEIMKSPFERAEIDLRQTKECVSHFKPRHPIFPLNLF